MQQPEDCDVHLRTSQSVKIRTLIETINPILVEGSISFDEKGMHLSGVNQIILCDLTIRANDVEEFVCNNKQQISINFDVLYSCLSSVSQDESICFQITKTGMNAVVPFLSVFIISGDANEYVFDFKVTLLALTKESFDIPETNFKSVVSIPSQAFHRVLRACDKRGSTVQICTRYQGKDKNFIIFHTHGDNSDLTFHMKVHVTDDPWVDNTCLKTDRYSLKYLLLVSKATSMSNYVTLFLAPDFVLAVKYCIGTIGSVTFCLAPLVEKSTFIPPTVSLANDTKHTQTEKVLTPLAKTPKQASLTGTSKMRFKRKRRRKINEDGEPSNPIVMSGMNLKGNTIDTLVEAIEQGGVEDLDNMLQLPF